MSTLYLDLEQTVIDNWQDGLLHKPQRIKHFIDANYPDINVDDVRIFSFAIYDDADKAKFEHELKGMLEATLDITITQWPSVVEIAAASQKLTGVRWLDKDTMGGMDIHEYITIVGKFRAFEDWVWLRHEDGNRVVLIDDVVPQRTIYDHVRDIQIDLINVDHLP